MNGLSLDVLNKKMSTHLYNILLIVILTTLNKFN